MPHHIPCGVLTTGGRDCDAPVAKGSPFNVCPTHYRAIRDYLADAKAASGATHRLSTPCPACNVCALMASTADRTATCDSCGQTVSADELRLALGAADPFGRKIRPGSRPPSSVVYYIRFGDRIKIGTTTSLNSRLASLPHDEILLVEPGSYDLERHLHRRFNRYLVAGREWFEAAPELLQFIKDRRLSRSA
jgi:ribosomal protein S27AE